MCVSSMRCSLLAGAGFIIAYVLWGRLAWFGLQRWWSAHPLAGRGLEARLVVVEQFGLLLDLSAILSLLLLGAAIGLLTRPVHESYQELGPSAGNVRLAYRITFVVHALVFGLGRLDLPYSSVVYSWVCSALVWLVITMWLLYLARVFAGADLPRFGLAARAAVVVYLAGILPDALASTLWIRRRPAVVGMMDAADLLELAAGVLHLVHFVLLFVVVVGLIRLARRLRWRAV